jgi:hypothetical protein
LNRALLRSTLIEDLNQLACPAAQDLQRADPARARESLNRLRFLDTSELDRFLRQGWLARGEADRIERLASFLSERLTPVPEDRDPIGFAHADGSWRSAREQALELVMALDAFVDVGVPGWGRQYRPAGTPG